MIFFEHEFNYIHQNYVLLFAATYEFHYIFNKKIAFPPCNFNPQIKIIIYNTRLCANVSTFFTRDSKKEIYIPHFPILIIIIIDKIIYEPNTNIRIRKKRDLLYHAHF